MPKPRLTCHQQRVMEEGVAERDYRAACISQGALGHRAANICTGGEVRRRRRMKAYVVHSKGKGHMPALGLA